MNKNKLTDLLLLINLTLLSTFFSLYFQFPFLHSTLMFFALPSIFLTYKAQKYALKTFLFSLVVSILAVLIVEPIAAINNVWTVNTLFNFKLFNLIALEQFVWGFFFVYYIVIFYKHFFDKKADTIINEKMRDFFYLSEVLLIVMLLGSILTTDFPKVDYTFLIGGVLLFLLPALIVLAKSSDLLPKFVKTGAYFAFVTILAEFTALRLDHWEFPGSFYIGTVNFLDITFPLEEFIFFCLFGAIGVLTYYEVFDDDLK